MKTTTKKQFSIAELSSGARAKALEEHRDYLDDWTDNFYAVTNAMGLNIEIEDSVTCRILISFEEAAGKTAKKILSIETPGTWCENQLAIIAKGKTAASLFGTRIFHDPKRLVDEKNTLTKSLNDIVVELYKSEHRIAQSDGSIIDALEANGLVFDVEGNEVQYEAPAGPSEEVIAIANAFSAKLYEWLGAETMVKVIKENQFNDDECASHNHCDANQAMIDVCEEAGIELWTKEEDPSFTEEFNEVSNEAWTLAKKNNFNQIRNTFTPGEWRVSEDFDTIVDSKGFGIVGLESTAILENWGDHAAHWGNKPGLTYRDLSDAEVEANARLIAQTPWLLDRLQITNRFLAEIYNIVKDRKKSPEDTKLQLSELVHQMQRQLDKNSQCIERATKKQ